MSHGRENSKIRRRSAGPGDELHVVTGSSGASVENLRSGDLQDGRGDVRVQDQQGQALVKGQKTSPEMSIYIGIPQGAENVEQDDSDPPVENFDLFQYGEDDEGDDDADDETFQPEDDDPDRLEHSRVNNRRGGGRRGGGTTRFFRKRKRSGSHGGNDSNYVPPYKKRYRRQNSVLPSKFLLGGNIRDPLNLASLADARVNAESNAETPKSSPLPVPLYKAGEVPVFIPKNPDDPLGLQTETQNPHDFIAGIRNNAAKGRKRHRKRTGRKRTDSECSVDKSEYDSDTKVEKDKDASVSDEAHGSSKVDRKEFVKPVAQGKVVPQTTVTVPEEKVSPLKPTPVEEKEVEKVPDSEEGVEETKPSTSSASQPTSAAKKKPRTRRRNNKKFKPGALGQLLSNMANRQTSDYVPLGTPSRNETSGWYQFGTPGRGSDYQYEISGSPFQSQSPSLSKFYTDYIENDSHEHYTMEPFSPPPANEPKRRRVVEVEQAKPQEEAGEAKSEVTEKNNDDNDDDKFVKPEVPPSKAFYRKRNHGHRVDPIVSPVVFQPGSRRRVAGHHHHHGRKGHEVQKSEKSGIKYRNNDQKFQHGNYNRYYGYRSTGENDDLRLRAFTKDFFANKDVLDVGCNIGHVTLTIARDYGAKMVRGIDIDSKLIQIAKKNVKHYVDRDPTDESVRFPQSCSLMYGMLQPPPANLGDTRSIPFPYNVSFSHENYVLDSDDDLKKVEPEFDVILCLSITKWIHLNNGDDGLKRFFRRTFLHLRPGGKLVLEPQPWSSYVKKKKLTETIHRNFKAIRFFPDAFRDYLLNEVGYATADQASSPMHHSKGFQRPLIVFTKPTSTVVSSSSETITIEAMETETTPKGVATSSKVVKFQQDIVQLESSSGASATQTTIVSETKTELTSLVPLTTTNDDEKSETAVSDDSKANV